MLKHLTVIGLACALAACSPPAQQQGEDGAAPPSASAGGIQPGQYRTTVTMLEFPGMQSGNVNMTPTTTEDCVTSSDVAEFTQGSMVDADSGETCTQNSMNTSGGRIHGQASCTGPNGTRTMQLNGTYDANRVDMEISSTFDMPGAGPSTMRMQMASQRIGECPAGSDAN